MRVDLRIALYYFKNKINLKKIFGFFLLISSCFLLFNLFFSTLCAMFQVNFLNLNTAQDVLGNIILKKLINFFDKNIILFFLYNLLLISLIMILRFSNIMMIPINKMVFYCNKANF